jgi:hypothetical protein
MPIDYSTLNTKKDNITDESTFIKKVVDEIVMRYSRELDEFVAMVRDYLALIKSNVMTTYTDDDLQMQIIKLPMLMYFAGDGLEDIGSESEIAAYKRKELYNEIINSLDTSQYTIPDKKAKAEQGTETEDMMEKIYDRAYKKLKMKIEMATKLLESLKKVVDIRIAKTNKGRGGDEFTNK